MYRIEILENNVVQIFDENFINPVFQQESWPNGEPWSDESEARLWAEKKIESIENHNAPFAPEGPGLEGLPKPEGWHSQVIVEE